MFVAVVPPDKALEHLDELVERLTRAASRCTSMDTRITGGGAFPDVATARVVWAGLELAEDAPRGGPAPPADGGTRWVRLRNRPRYETVDTFPLRAGRDLYGPPREDRSGQGDPGGRGAGRDRP